MKALAFWAFLIVGITVNFPDARAADTNLPPRLTVELRDGSRVVGTSVEKDFKFRSELLGEIKLAAKEIRGLECVATNSARLTTVNGDTLTISFVDSSFAVNTSFGKVVLPVASVSKLMAAPDFGPGAYPPGLVGLWAGEGNGNDSVNGNSAVLTDITFADGKVGQAFSFNGTRSSMRIPASPVLDLGAGDGFTLMAWIKPADVDGYHPLLAWRDGSGSGLNSSICFNSTESGVLMCCVTDGEGNRFLVSNQGVLTSGVFQHIALTYDKASGIGTWYLNGVVVAQRHLSGLPASTKGDLWISHRDTTQGNWSSNRSFAGLMDEIALYNRALSAEEIQTVCNVENHGDTLTLPTSSNGWFETWMR